MTPGRREGVSIELYAAWSTAKRISKLAHERLVAADDSKAVRELLRDLASNADFVAEEIEKKCPNI